MIGRICENVPFCSDMRNVFCIDGTKQKRIFVSDTLIMTQRLWTKKTT